MRRLQAGGVRGIARGVLGAAIVAGLCAGLPACEKKAAQAAPAARAEMGPPAQEYTVRGEVVSLPDPANPASDFQVRHEAIDNFVDGNGKVVGMGAMVMPFPLAEGVSLEGLKAGDVVEVDFAVWWKPRRHWEATRVEKLPADTTLEFRPAQPPTPATMIEAGEPGEG